MLLLQILAQWWHPMASSEALDFLHWAMCAVSYYRIALAIGTASKGSVFYHCCLFVCCMAIGTTSKGGVFYHCCLFVCLFVALLAARAIRSQ